MRARNRDQSDTLPTGRGPKVSMPAIRRMVRQIVKRFQPESIILFGSHAYGKPDPESDVDILVVMPAGNEINQAIRIRMSVEHPFPLDLIVRTPETLRRRLQLHDDFLCDVMKRGKVLYEKTDRRMGSQVRSRPGSRRKPDRKKAAAD